MSDQFVGRALLVIHSQPEGPWTLQSLAVEAGCSRAVLAKRLRHLMHEGALGYLTRWRMQLAAGLLSRRGADIASVASKVGYRPDAFATAFKRWAGISPKEFPFERISSEVLVLRCSWYVAAPALRQSEFV